MYSEAMACPIGHQLIHVIYALHLARPPCDFILAALLAVSFAVRVPVQQGGQNQLGAGVVG